MDDEAAALESGTEEAFACFRDYDQIANELPIMCTSSRAYQQFRGRGDSDNIIQGYRDIDETEIPRLQDHAKNLTDELQIATARQFLNELGQLLRSLMLWVTAGGASGLEVEMSKDKKNLEWQNLNTMMDGLQQVRCPRQDNVSFQSLTMCFASRTSTTKQSGFYSGQGL
jgi:hypothetical protein